MLEQLIYTCAAAIALLLILLAAGMLGWALRGWWGRERRTVQPDALYAADGAWWRTNDGRRALDMLEGDPWLEGGGRRDLLDRAIDRLFRRAPDRPELIRG